MPDTTIINTAIIQDGIPAFKLFAMTTLCKSSSAARRLICQGGGYVNRVRIELFDQLIGPEDVDSSHRILLRAGKKRYHWIKVDRKEITI